MNKTLTDIAFYGLAQTMQITFQNKLTNYLKPTIMKSGIKIIAVFITLFFFYTAQAAPGKTFYYNEVISAANNVAFFKKSIKDIPVKSGWVKKQVAISWQTTIETNTCYFEIQRSFNGKDFETIETIPACGKSNNVCTYAFIDTKNENRRGQSYYRLKAIFTNGEAIVTEGAKAKKTGVFDMNQSYAEAAGMVAAK